jgi:DNA polymerase-3 subunit beta
MIIPGKSLAELMKMLSDEEDELMTIKPAKKHIVFVIGDLIFFTRLIDMKYIDYNRVIQDDLPIRVRIGRSYFMECLERAALVSEKRSASAAKSCLRLKFEGNLLKLSSTSLSGQISDELVCEKEGADLEIGFSCRYLLDILRAVDGEEVVLCLRGPRNAMIVRPAEEDGEKDQLYMVLPVKLSE